MKDRAFTATLISVVVVGLGVGWVVAAPPPVNAALHLPTPSSKPVTPASSAPATQAAGPEARQQLRLAVFSAAGDLRAKPCDEAAKARFLAAAQAYIAPYMRAQHESAEEGGPPEWRTFADQQVSQVFQDLPAQGYVNGEFVRSLTGGTPQGRATLVMQSSAPEQATPDASPQPTPACLRARGQLAPDLKLRPAVSP